MGRRKELKLKNIFFIFSIGIIFFGMIYFISFDVTQKDIQSVYTKISVITRESSSEAIVNLQQGIEQAATDMDVEMSIVTLTERNNAQEQQKLLQREISSGAEAIVIMPVEDEELKKTIEIASEKIPIICMANSLQSNAVSATVLGQDEEMGKELGRRIFVKGVFNKKILILESSLQCDAVYKRETALFSMLENRAKSILKQPFVFSDNTIQNLEKIIQQTEPDIIITLEPTVLDIAAEAVQHLQKNHVMVYGFGMTTKTPSYIEKENITASMIQNDFNLGYLSIYSAMEILGKTKQREKGIIDYAFVNKQNMYTKENQRLLFPFVR